MELASYSFLALSSLFVILNPLAVAPAFLAITPSDSAHARVRMARTGCMVATGVLLTFVLLGNYLFKILGITLPAFQIAGSIILMTISLDMLRGQRSKVQQTPEEMSAGAEMDDVAITPLAVPFLAGPGSISTALILLNQAEDWRHRLVLCGTIVFVYLCTFGFLKLAAHGARWLNPITLKLMTRLMGLILAAVSVQFTINALRDLGLITEVV